MNRKAERLYPRTLHLTEMDRFSDTQKCYIITELKREKMIDRKKVETGKERKGESRRKDLFRCESHC